MKINSQTLKNIFQGIAEGLEPKDCYKIIFPLIDEIEKWQSTLEIVDSEKKYYEREENKLKQKISELEEEIEEKELDEAEDVKDLRNMVPQLKDEIEQLKKQNEENLKSASKREDQRFLKFQTERENLLKENDILEKENEELRERNKILNDENKILSKNIQGFQNRISNLKNIFESLNKEIPLCDLYEKIKEIGNLLDVESSGHIRTINDMEGRFQKMKKVKSELEEQWKFLQSENERKDNIIKSIEKNSTDLLMSNENLREEIKKTENTNAILHGRIMTEKSENKALKEQISKLEDTNRSISRKLQNKNEEINMLKEEIDRLKSARIMSS